MTTLVIFLGIAKFATKVKAMSSIECSNILYVFDFLPIGASPIVHVELRAPIGPKFALLHQS
jgi:hypothetical protein